MEFSNKKKLLKIIKIIAINLIPAAGVIIFNWEVFEIALTYLLETGVVFVIAYIDHYFIRKETKQGVVNSILQLITVMIPLTGVLFFLAGMVFYFTGPNFAETLDMLNAMAVRLKEFEFVYVLFFILLFNLIFYLSKKFSAHFTRSTSLWKTLEKIFYVYCFLTISAIVYGMLPHNALFGLFLFIAAKILIDYLLERSAEKS